MPPKPRPPKERFYDNKFVVDKKTGCWNWIAAMGGDEKHSCGRFNIKGKCVHSHRASWIVHYGEIPEGLVVCHKCDNRLCVNPQHLWLDTQSNNLRDMFKKKRYGSNQKLDKKSVLKIRKLYDSGVSPTEIGRRFDIGRGTVWRIAKRKIWSYV